MDEILQVFRWDLSFTIKVAGNSQLDFSFPEKINSDLRLVINGFLHFGLAYYCNGCYQGYVGLMD